MADNANPLAMSDDEFMKMDPAGFESDEDISSEEEEETSAGESVETDEDEQSESGEQDNEEEDDDDTTSESDQDDPTDDDHGPDDLSENEDDSDESDKTGDNESDAGDTPDDKASGDGEDEEKKETVPVTDEEYLNIGRQVMGEFKANGKMIKVKSADDAIQLMQMGANYHEKMRGLKPAMKVLKLLENNGLMDSSKLNYLIDLHQKKPEAITQLLKDSNVDPMDLDLQGDETYVPNERTVSDAELLLDEVLDSISGSPSYQKTLSVLTDDWDSKSREMLASKPQYIRTINGHIESGVFDQVIQAVDYEKRLGKFAGVSDFEAYMQVGSYMHENGLFVNASGRQPQQVATQNTDSQQSRKDDTAQEEQRKNRKKAASPTRRKGGTEQKKDAYNPLAMSDDEFAKLNKLNL